MGDAEIFDCTESDYLKNTSIAVMRRHIVKKFNFNLLIREDLRGNQSYIISLSRLE